MLPGLPAGTEVSGHTDSACCVTGWTALSEGRLSTRRALRKPDVQALRVALAHVGEAAGRGVTFTGLAWQPAEHNLPRGDDRRALVLARANRSVDAGAGVSAESGRDEELRFFATHEPLVHAPLAHYTHGGAAITGDVRTRTKRAVGLQTAVRASASGWRAAAAGTARRMASNVRRGEVDAKATAAAYRGAGAMVQMVMLRARLGRLRGSARELVRRRRDDSREGLERVLAHAGGAIEQRCVCGAAKETRAHWRTKCVLATAQRLGPMRAVAEQLAACGCAF